jgi:uncharacterized membrane protein YqiK
MNLEANPTYLIVFGAAALFILILAIGIVFARFFQRAGADEALVRTGSGGERVVIGGGITVMPIFHQIMRVSLKSVPLMVAREGKNALVTADKIKANVTTELYVKVEPTKEDVLSAARSFGTRNLEANAVRDLVEGKLTDALRAVAANQRFQELHANRKEFAEHVQRTLSEELKKNGLTLESVAITTFAQLPIGELDPNDVFDAEGRRAITETVEANRKLTNTIKRDTDIAVQHKDVDARKQALALELDQKKAEADQARLMAEYSATQKAEQARRIAEINATQEAEANKAILLQQRAQEQAAYEKQQAIETVRILQEQTIAKTDLERQQAVAVADAVKQKGERAAQIDTAKAIETAEIERAKAVQAAEIAKQQAIETAAIAKQIAVTKSVEQKARAEAERAKASAEQERAEQEIITVQKTAEAERLKQIALIEASRKAQEQRLAAEVEAYQKTTAAQAEADRARIQALAEAEASQKRAEAIERLAAATLAKGKAEAEARRLMVAADNQIKNELVLRDVAGKLIDRGPEIARELMSPVTALSDVKVLNVQGLVGPAGGASGSPVTGVLKTLLDASALAPVMKSMLDFGGVDAAGLVDKAKDVLRPPNTAAPGAQSSRSKVEKPAGAPDAQSPSHGSSGVHAVELDGADLVAVVEAEPEPPTPRGPAPRVTGS